MQSGNFRELDIVSGAKSEVYHRQLGQRNGKLPKYSTQERAPIDDGDRTATPLCIWVLCALRLLRLSCLSPTDTAMSFSLLLFLDLTALRNVSVYRCKWEFQKTKDPKLEP